MIYLDNAATTFPCQEALDLFAKESVEHCANASSPHAFGRSSSRLLEQYREGLLSCFGLNKTHQAIFLSGATEANNMALKGIAFSYSSRGKKILVSSIEHASVSTPAKQLAAIHGFDVKFLPVNAEGKVEPKTLEEAMDKDVILVSIMGVNNELGSVNDLSALADIVHHYPKAFFHSDLTQAIGKIDVPFAKLDLFSYSGHKVHGLKGSGAIVYKKNIRFAPLLGGGDQEFSFRSGTVALPLAGALTLVTKKALAEQKENYARAAELRALLLSRLDPELVSVNSPKDAIPHLVNISLRRHKASVIVEALSERGIYVSSISACNSKGEPISNVLLCLGKEEDDARNSIRISFSSDTKRSDVEALCDALDVIFKEVRPR